MQPFHTGKWNYTEDIEFKVILVTLIENIQQPYHWQNAFAGQKRQVVYIKYGAHVFVIDNEDGSGLEKIRRGGGPDSYSAHVADYHYIADVPMDMWRMYNKDRCLFQQRQYDIWMKAHHPEALKEIENMRQAFNQGRLRTDQRGAVLSQERPSDTAK